MKSTVLCIALTLASAAGAQQSDAHHDSVTQHVDHVMGFSQRENLPSLPLICRWRCHRGDRERPQRHRKPRPDSHASFAHRRHVRRREFRSAHADPRRSAAGSAGAAEAEERGSPQVREHGEWLTRANIDEKRRRPEGRPRITQVSDFGSPDGRPDNGEMRVLVRSLTVPALKTYLAPPGTPRCLRVRISRTA